MHNDDAPIRARLEAAEPDARPDLAAAFLGLPRLEDLPRPGDVASWKIEDWERHAARHGFEVAGRSKHSYLFRHTLVPFTFGLASSPGDQRSWTNTCGDLRRRWRILLEAAVKALLAPAPGLSDEALRRRILDDFAHGTLGDAEARAELARAREAHLARERAIARLMKESGRPRHHAEAIIAAVHDELGGDDEASWTRAAETALQRLREQLHAQREAARAARMARRLAYEERRRQRAIERAQRAERERAEQAAAAAERARAAEREALLQAVEAEHQQIHRAVHEAARHIAHLVAERLEHAQARVQRLQQVLAELRPLLDQPTPEHLEHAKALIAQALAPPHAAAPPAAGAS